MSERRSPEMPSRVSDKVGFFDRFASATSGLVSRAPFFAFAVVLVVAWLIEGVVRVIVIGKASAFLDEVYQLQINPLTTIVTFLLVALLQNTQTRSDEATQDKLNAIADALGDLMANFADGDDNELEKDIEELRAAVGLEDVVSAKDQ